MATWELGLVASLSGIVVVALLFLASRPRLHGPGETAHVTFLTEVPVFARTHFGQIGGYIDIDGVLVWAAMHDPDPPVRPGERLRLLEYDRKTFVATVDRPARPRDRDEQRA